MVSESEVKFQSQECGFLALFLPFSSSTGVHSLFGYRSFDQSIPNGLLRRLLFYGIFITTCKSDYSCKKFVPCMPREFA